MKVKEYVKIVNNRTLKGIRGIRKHADLLDLDVSTQAKIDEFGPCIVHTIIPNSCYLYSTICKGMKESFFTDFLFN